MPCKSYGLPAQACKVGGQLAKVVGTICWKCYAKRGHYQYPVVVQSQQNRLESLDHPEWVDALVALIGDDRYFRWHDSGDLQSVNHLYKIATVCIRTPHTLHWLPTQERKIVEEYMAKWEVPPNLVIRASAVWFDQPAKPIKGIDTTSGSHKDEPPIGHACPAPEQGGECGTCRACWDKEVKHVSYHYH